MVRVVNMVAAAVLVGAAAAGCSSSPPVVEKAGLEADISNRLSEAGQKPQSVTCSSDLEGVVDKSITCEVVLSDTNAIEPIVKVTQVEDTTVSYEMTPALSKEQLQKSVGALVAENAGEKPTKVLCKSGLEGQEGNKASCSLELNGEPLDFEATVTSVEGLLMNFDVSQI